MKPKSLSRLLFLWIASGGVSALLAWVAVPVASDHTVFMPGTQPNASFSLEATSGCDNCHGGYNSAVEPVHTWRGSMMAQAARDPLWAACLVVADQDSIWALGNPNAGDLCIRCHVPGGWLAGRSDPPNLTGLSIAEADFDGINCDFCHKMVDPVLARRQQPELPAETNPDIAAAADQTYTRDRTVLSTVALFSGTPFLNTSTDLPTFYGNGQLPNYREASAGQYFIDPQMKVRRGPRFDVSPKSHDVLYSRFHRSKYFCATCHDVSNPALARVLGDAGIPEEQAGATYFHVERTFSEFLLSDYGADGGADTNPAIAAAGIPHAAKCQDCHMADGVGPLCNKNVPVRNDLAVHDLTGGNTWISGILASVDSSGPVYSAYNDAILSGNKYPGASIETGGLQGIGQALLDGKTRAGGNLSRAASLELVGSSPWSVFLRIRNNTGHKLISGFPEGRRMWLNVQFLDPDGGVISEVNPYEPLQTTIDGQGNFQYVSGAILSPTREDLVYEAKMTSTLTGEEETFHFVLATGRHKDNRIPPRGFRTEEMDARLVGPRWNNEDAPGYFTAEEYAGGYDEITIAAPSGAVGWKARLYYQTTSKEYVEFLRDEIKGEAATLDSPTPSGEAQAYIVQSDPFFVSLKGWGDAIWDLWLANGGSAPVLMTAAISPPFVTRATREPDGYHIQFQSIVGWSYRLEKSTDLSEGMWTNVGTIEGDGTEMEFLDTGAATDSRDFYRLVSELAVE